MIEHVVVMAASPSGRMDTLTRTRPKAMLPILGTPMIARVMEDYYQAGIRHFTVVVGEKEGSAAMWLTEHWHKDVDLKFAPQGHRRGTASTLFATRELIDKPFIITSCDNLVPTEHIKHLSQYFDTHPRDEVVLSLYYAPDEVVQEGAPGVLLNPRGHVMYISEMPTGAHQDFMTALPIYGFTPRILDYLDQVPLVEERGEHMLAMAIQLIIDNGLMVGALETKERYRLDTPDDLLKAHIALMADQEEPVVQSDLLPTVEVTPPVWIDAGVTVANNVTIGPNVYLETGTRVGPDSVIKNAVVLARQIGSGQHVDGEVVYTDKT